MCEINQGFEPVPADIYLVANLTFINQSRAHQSKDQRATHAGGHSRGHVGERRLTSLHLCGEHTLAGSMVSSHL